MSDIQLNKIKQEDLLLQQLCNTTARQESDCPPDQSGEIQDTHTSLVLTKAIKNTVKR